LTKTNGYRLVPLNAAVRTLLEGIPPHVGCPYVFPNPAKLEAWRADGIEPLYRDSSVNHAFVKACRKASVENATFHDLRHTFVTNARRAGVDYFTIMGITGHKTMSVFKRYNTINEADLRRAMGQIDTYVVTSAGSQAAQHV
jgi:integrase